MTTTTPNTLPERCHEDFCDCNPFWTDPRCWEKSRVEKRKKKEKK